VVCPGRVVGMVGVTGDVGARCWSVPGIQMRTVRACLQCSYTVFVLLMRG
jgi:hypothetical protein